MIVLIVLFKVNSNNKAEKEFLSLATQPIYAEVLMGEDARKSLSDNNMADATNGEEINDFVKMSYNEKREKIKENILKAIKEKEEGRQFVWTPTGLELMKKYYPDLYDRLSEEEKQGEVMSPEGEQLN